ncbi:hypothetical protein EV06_0821 [Prochlorococcus sp. MIT 0602]|nr:hypothetical protein EV06_0821 [Prochlorococcus sp. MIT 0602]KGG17232.1 hypothetical protein EV07_0669 [Prochlorococcus sp. MIT 0603]
MKHLLSNKRARWLFSIGLVAIGIGFASRDVISYPTECMQEKVTLGPKTIRS